MRRGEVRWYRFHAPGKQRPVVILTRDSAIEYLGVTSHHEGDSPQDVQTRRGRAMLGAWLGAWALRWSASEWLSACCSVPRSAFWSRGCGEPMSWPRLQTAPAS